MPRATKPKNQQRAISQPHIPIAEVFSFLKEITGQLSWTAHDLAQTLKINLNEAGSVLQLLELQGYVKPQGKSEWITTTSGETMAAAKPPRFRRDAAERALSNLRRRIGAINRDSNAPFKITKAVAFGDFFRKQPRVQSVDVGILLAEQNQHSQPTRVQHRAKASFLKSFRHRSALLNIHPYEDWMSTRSHVDLLDK